MPYVICPGCEITAYTAARFTTVDDCPVCGERLRPKNAERQYSAAQWTMAGSGGAAGGGAERARSGLPFQSVNVPR